MSGRFVAPITTTSFSSSRPSSSVSSWLTTRSVTCESELAPRVGATASSSSNKMIVGETCLARRNVSRTPFSDSPTHLLSSSGPFMLIKLASLSVATACARSVFPVPGGPKSNTPFGGLVLMLLNASANFIGHSTASISSCFAASRPPTSCHFTFGASTNTSRIAEGSMFFWTFVKSTSLT